MCYRLILCGKLNLRFNTAIEDFLMVQLRLRGVGYLLESSTDISVSKFPLNGMTTVSGVRHFHFVSLLIICSEVVCLGVLPRNKWVSLSLNYN